MEVYHLPATNHAEDNNATEELKINESEAVLGMIRIARRRENPQNGP